MTIHSDWSRLLHSECPEAFLPSIPVDVPYGVGIIDGHLQLMCLDGRLGSWERFLQYMFVNPIKKLFDAGCPVVVLCFDSYDSVPIYKAMTQQKRASRVAAPPSCTGDELPPTIPPDAMACMLNRRFKLKVIDMACGRLPGLVVPLMTNAKQRFIVDYKRVVQYVPGVLAPAPVEGMAPTGESDIKFARYVDRFGHALVHAIDGDYMAIALLYYARRGGAHYKIFIHRQLAQLQREEDGAKKRKRGNDEEEEAPKSKGKKKTPKCWVDMQLLFVCIARIVKQARGGAAPTEADAVHAAVTLMLCAGTDFSRSLPLVGPRRIWEALPLVVDTLLRAAPCGSGPIDYESFANGVVGKLYAAVFARHVRAQDTGSLGEVLDRLRNPHTTLLSATTVQRLPREEQVRTTLKTINWIVHHYWTVINGPIEAPLDGTNGFVRGAGGGVAYEDDVVTGSS